ncbi:bifunctional phosphopantothenoylcysteine decarboxylase/phosphopantothenate--cysteine ligase CoaBC [Aquimarina sp. TRL1]|uniref:bifunctional phosphopantothenoylcysteine decarboxylase/phosphopantothenate--cysteine ligase CoaBC n=1 Tax=Aquimarina sp. (strain TRL1) TaxID=2736252 RepID=UPI00158BE44C|nr:bifunctional phosphopantothenoylcysteine decarboxylase/phosphopantothenate--cysteine ligase CoaBC [Aquimarina sp. TRL1]QKX07482.1 bifunctional phosphopantothenoylcysteine decarboxylase/phosphopantothenate--cysteine ligase CoaBC [Aquimarina sp. TRL1]
MSVLSGKRIVLGVTAGIAAYKTATLVRLCIKAGAEVKVVMTPGAKDFVTPLTLSTLSKNPVQSTFYDKDNENELWNNHVELGLWADLMVIAPATANTLSKMASGTCDNLLLATYLSAKCPVYFAPAMDLDMYKHPSTEQTLDTLQSYGNIMIPAESGELASGLVGKGRMAEPEHIVAFIEADIEGKLPMRGVKVLITGGPTYEAIDPVRFIGNHSSGRMGIELATYAASKGAEVTLVLGPSSIPVSQSGITVVPVMSAQQMYEQVESRFHQVDIAIASAAVADYRPKTVSAQKIKKTAGDFVIELERTTDILKWMGSVKTHQFLVGFALETNNEEENAKRKLQTKNLDLIVLNSMNDKGAGFKGKTNKVSLINHKLEIKAFELKTKAAVAEDIFNEINQLRDV